MKHPNLHAAGIVLLLLSRVTPLWSAQKTVGSEEEKAQKNGPSRPDPLSLQALKVQIEAMKAEYEKRIKDLEAQVEQLQTRMLQAAPELEPAAQALQPSAGRAVQSIPGALNPAISVVGNFVGRGDSSKVFNGDGNRIDNKLNLREAEIDMRVPVDPYADAVLIASIGADTPGKFSIDLEEAYVNIKKLPFLGHSPLGLRFKVGRFRPAFGKINILHTHDLPQSFRPLPVQEFLGEEGFVQNGVSGNFYIPTPWDSQSSLDATFEFLGAGDVAISPEARRAAYLGHLRWFRTFREVHNVELGWSTYYHPRASHFAATDFHGIDFMYRWKPFRQGEWKSFLLGGEMMFARSAYPGAAESPDVARALEGLPPGKGKPQGYTLFMQWQFDRRKYAGVRYDQTDTLLNPALQRRSVTPFLSYYFSEFLRLRLNYEHRWSDLYTENKRNSAFVELNWVFGAHPPEPFWVNR